MLDNLSSRFGKIVKTMRGQARLTEDNTTEMLREVRMAMLEADVALPVVREFIAKIKAKALGEEVVGSLTPGQALVGIVHNEQYVDVVAFCIVNCGGGDVGGLLVRR
jgi:signal recognition particle subunit SRP54